MLIQISIENFRSIRDEQIIDLFSSTSRDERSGNTFLLESAKMRVLRAVGFYGANAAGKSNVFKALGAIISLIVGENFKPDAEIPIYDPYRLESDMRSKPSRISLEFALPEDGIAPYRRFLYEIAFNKTCIKKERLVAYPNSGRSIVLFSRKEYDTYKSIRLSTAIVKEGRRVPFFRNQSYLSAAWKSADAPSTLRVVASYLCGEFRLSKYKKCVEIHALPKERIASALLPYADFGIRKVVARKRNMDPDKIATMQRYLSKEEFEITLAAMKKRGRGIEYFFAHTQDADKDALIGLDEESEGTQAFLRFLSRVINNLDNGFTMLEDEIDTSMHPFLAEFIIRLFNDPDVNVHNAQLLFSTHNLALLSESLLRKDQIWFAEKKDGVSGYFSLQDFESEKVTPSSPFAAWYMEGRFGGIPQIDYSGFVKAIQNLRKEAGHAEKA